MELDKTLVFVKELGEVTLMKAIDFVKNEVTVISEEEAVTVHSLDDVVLIQKVLELDGGPIYNYDVFEAKNSEHLYELEMVAFGQFQFYSLNENYERVQAVDRMDVSTFLKHVDAYTLVGGRHELVLEKAEEEQMRKELEEFNVVIVKDVILSSIGAPAYFYACNNKDEGEVDLISVTFLGATILPDNNYHRKTVSYDEFFDLLNGGDMVEVEPAELNDYAFEMFRISKIKFLDNAEEMSDEPTACTCKQDEGEGCSECPADPYADEDGEASEPPSDFAEGEEDYVCRLCHKDEEDCECELWETEETKLN